MRLRRPPPDPTDPEFRHGLLMRDVTDLLQRVERLERAQWRASVRPQVKTAGMASAVAGALFALAELLRYVGVFK